MKQQSRLRTKRYPAGRGMQRALALAVFALALFVLSQTLRLGDNASSQATRAPISPVTPTPPAKVLLEPQPTLSDVPQPGFPTPTMGESGNQSIVIPAQDWYTIQLGVYENADAAALQAAQYVTRGAAGYVLEDDRYRVLAAVYQTREDAETIKARLMEGQKIDTYIYRISAEEVELNVTAAAAQIVALRDGFAVVQDTLIEMGRLSAELDKQNMDGGSVILGAQEARLRVQRAQKALEDVLGTSGSEVVTGLAGLLRTASDGLEMICAQNAQESVHMTSKLKYHQIDLLWRYIQYVRQITAQRI